MTPFADQNWIAPAHEVPRPERRITNNVADLVKAHHRRSQRRHVRPRRCAFLPAAAFDIVIDDVTAIGAFSGQKILERAAPDRGHEPTFAENFHDLIGIEPGLLASRQQMTVVDLGEPIAPLGAGQPFHQALKRTGAGHSSLHRIAGCRRSMLLRWNLSKVRYESTGSLYLGRQNQQDFRLVRCLRMGHHGGSRTALRLTLLYPLAPCGPA